MEHETNAEEWQVIAQRVEDTVTAVISDDDEQLMKAFEALGELAVIDVIAELSLWLEDLSTGIDNDDLLEAVTLGLPPHPKELLSALLVQDIVEVQNILETDDVGKVLAAVIVLTAGLKDARESLDGKLYSRL